ncbi:single-stranded-DNA-specific exonuclease RecJ [Macrococcus armenti]|uniref:single-stranded-DNA-specific exonuclease RecJ n=1 Tax=Macrococcus armenti TaxID=2875764 RepID=UPI001CCEE263|nr:single-stranded-DNA-specific exonuclease RecJ [Macrococcus armenti]UBH12370.1 single-stranded-DNA-specific exonuclease RecJ [Macrococcus armenti]
MDKTVWTVKQPVDTIPAALVKKYNITDINKKILESRNIFSDEALHDIFIADDIHDPFLMFQMDKAVERIKSAINNNEMILIYGDYDADGVTSVTVLIDCLKSIGANVGWYIPNRFTEGYGPNEAAFREAHEAGVSLIITVDNGIQGHHEINVANELGMDVIITDHHEIGHTLPEAYAILHPMHPEGNYPFHHLAGVGVSYKLGCALTGTQNEHILGFVAIGTISDLVSLTGENRVLVKRGLKALNAHTPPGLKALLDQASFKGEINEETVGFIIGPRLNAVGRLDDARLACELLQIDNEDEAIWMSEQVNQFNTERKEVVSAITEQAIIDVEEKIANGNRFIIVAKEGWNEGVLGIVASRITEQYHLPAIVLNIDYDNDYAKGSARSIPQVSMYDSLDHSRNLISKFGGHHMAAGMTLPIENIEQLEKELNDYLDMQVEGEIIQEIDIDAAIEMADITVKNINDLDKLRPFGTDFSVPLLSLMNAEITDIKQIGQNQAHLKMTVHHTLNALMWNEGSRMNALPAGSYVNLAGTLQLNEWNGNVQPQMIVQHIKVEDMQMIDFRNVHPNTYKFLKDEHAAFIIHPGKSKLNEHYYYYGESVTGYDKVIFRDLPQDESEFLTTYNSLDATFIYFIFHTQKQLYFEGMPTSEKFKQLYKCIMIKPHIDLQKDGGYLLQAIKVSPDTLLFMFDVYAELGLVVKDGHHIKKQEVNKKVDLLSASTYQSRLNQLKLESKLLFSSFDELKQFILTNNE